MTVCGRVKGYMDPFKLFVIYLENVKTNNHKRIGFYREDVMFYK